jgi:hypothetical protein
VPQVLKRSFPQSEQPLRRLVADHLKLRDEPLKLALYYAPAREPQDIFLFEVIEGFGANGISPDHELFEVAYADRTGFPLEPGQHLHLILTNPNELKVAFENHWANAMEVRDAVRREDFILVYPRRQPRKLMEVIRGG